MLISLSLSPSLSHSLSVAPPLSLSLSFSAGHFDHESLELLAASVYLDGAKSGSAPQSATPGFLRCLNR